MIFGQNLSFGQTYAFWANLIFLGKSDIFGQILYFWVDLIFLGRSDIFEQTVVLDNTDIFQSDLEISVTRV